MYNYYRDVMTYTIIGKTADWTVVRDTLHQDSEPEGLNLTLLYQSRIIQN